MLISRQGQFGPIELRDTLTTREILLNGQCQGGALLTPSARCVDDELPDDAPGPVAASSYAMGWLHAGVHNRNGSGIMIGLGSGAGAVQLLQNFPQIDLTVIEVDPVMVTVALAGFPLLHWYMNQGRLNIVVADATKYLESRYDVWDFACADAYTGSNELVPDYIPLLCDRADNIYFNVIDTLDGPLLEGLQDYLARKRMEPVAGLFKAMPWDRYDNYPFGARSNWILTTQPTDWATAGHFLPFADIRDPNVATAQRTWDAFLAHGVTSDSE
jgi:hypothetical protein